MDEEFNLAFSFKILALKSYSLLIRSVLILNVWSKMLDFHQVVKMSYWLALKEELLAFCLEKKKKKSVPRNVVILKSFKDHCTDLNHVI